MSSLGFIFPGQGSQSVGMLADISHHYPEISETYNQASEVLGYDLWKLVQEGPTEALDQTMHTQPAILAGSYAIWQIISARTQLQPKVLAGHSLGEYTALVCSQALKFTDAVKLVAARGKYMQEAVPAGEGALAAIVGLEDAKVLEICQKAALENEVLAPVNFNSPGQVVIAGHAIAVERAIILAKESGARLAKLLPVSVPSHCVLMKPAAEQLKQLLKTMEIKAPSIPVLNNINVEFYHDADSIRDGLEKQLYMPVRWVEIIQTFVKMGVGQMIECGPGKVLSGLNKRIDAGIQSMNTNDLAGLQHFLKEE